MLATLLPMLAWMILSAAGVLLAVWRYDVYRSKDADPLEVEDGE